MPCSAIVSYRRFERIVLLASSVLETKQRTKTFPHMRGKGKNGFRAVGGVGEERGHYNGWC
jgi:hypothetical protein